MFEDIIDWFSELDWNILGFAFIFWAICLLVLWKLMYDPDIIKFPIKIALSIILLPLCYIIIYLMSDR